MLVLVFIGSGLECILGLVCYFYVFFIMVISNVFIEVVIVYLVVYNFVYFYFGLMYECGIGFLGVIFLMIVMEISLNFV